MFTVTRTHTKTYALLDAWAQTLPWDCDEHDYHSPIVNDPCAIEDCREPLLKNEVCYYVTQLPRDANDREQAVCWRHIRPDSGPIREYPHTADHDECPWSTLYLAEQARAEAAEAKLADWDAGLAAWQARTVAAETQRDDAETHAEAAEAKLAAIRELHPVSRGILGDHDYCGHCTEVWPCPTVSIILDGSGT